MARLIDAGEKQIIIQALKMHHDSQFTPGVYEHSVFGKAALLLESTVDAVKVVRCKDCVHWKNCGSKGGNSDDDLQYIGVCKWADCCRREMDFCSYGERRTQ